MQDTIFYLIIQQKEPDVDGFQDGVVVRDPERERTRRRRWIEMECRLMFSIWVEGEPILVADTSNSSFIIIIVYF